MRVRHSKASSSSPLDDETSVDSNNSSDQNWKCTSCGALNENFRQFCDGCGDPRPGASLPKGTGISMDELLTPKDSEDTGDETSIESSSSTFHDTITSSNEDNNGVEDTEEQSDTFEDKPSRDQPLEKSPPPKIETPPSTPKRKGRSSRSKKPETVLTGTFKEPSSPASPVATLTTPDTFELSATSTTSSTSSSPSFPRATTGQHYALIFVNSPASSLIKSRVSLEFDDFPTITIGRSPENVVVVPDQEVSRKHAQLNLEGDRVILKDLNSSNGTFLYNGTEFQRVGDSVEVRPNSIIKFGTGTIVRLVSE